MATTGPPEPEARRRVLDAVLTYPGLRTVDIARIAGLTQSHVEYHLDALLDSDLLVEASYDHRRHYPVPGPLAPAVTDAEWVGLLREDLPLGICLLLLNEPEGAMSHSALHAHLPIAKSTLSFHLNKLTEVGLLARREDGAYVPSDPDRLLRLMVRFRPLPEALEAHLSSWLPLYRRLTRS